jgi:zinc transport system substrate-binding protein
MKKSLKIILILTIVLIASFAGILALSRKDENNKKLSIVTTNFPAYDFARAIVGNKAEITMLVKPGAEVHDFELSPNDIIKIKDCDFFVYTGGESDVWVDDVLTSNNISQDKTFKLMDAVELFEEESVEGMEERDDEEEVEYDEHVWTSLKNAQKIVAAMDKKLGKISPEHQKLFHKNAEAYQQKLASLDKEFQAIVDQAKRKTLVFGDRFPLRYFVEDYGLDYYAAFPGCSEQTEASSKTIAFLADKIKSENIPVVLKIELSSGTVAETLAKETGAKILTFHSAHNVSAGDFEAGLTYADIMKGNLNVLEEALK